MDKNMDKNMDNTLTLVAKLNYLMNEMVYEELKKIYPEGLSTSHGSIIFCLKSKKSVTMGEIAEEIQKSPQTVTALVSKLVKYGYAETIKDEVDKRVRCVRITEKGETLLDEIVIISKKLYAKQYMNIDNEERKAFRKTLQKMIGNFY